MSVHTILSVMLQASDSLRRSTGLVFDHLNRGPVETEWIAVLSEPGFTLRYYGDVNASAPPVLVLPAPIKRSYIFDLLPSVSVVQRLLDGGFSVYLMEWREADPGASWGLAQYAVEWIASATQAIAEEHGIRPLLVGHSLGGTFAAISAACTPQLVGKLLLIEAPLRFGPEAGALAAIVESSPHADLIAQITGGAPGSLLDVASCAAAPEEFLAGRWQDAAACALDPEAWAIHQRVIRWTLDEFTLPTRLFTDIVELLYRGDMFARGHLLLSGRTIASAGLVGVPTATVIDKSSRLVPPKSALSPLPNPAIFSYERETGVALQHVGPLVGRRAHRELWPNLVKWMKAA